MILPSAAAHRVFIDHAQAGSGLSGVEDARLGAGDGVDKLARQRGDAAHALQEVQDHALTRKNHTRIVADYRDRLTFVQANAVENFGMRRPLVMRSDGAVESGVDIED